MTTGRPVIFLWDGEVMMPRHQRLADRQFVVGETYALVSCEERSTISHKHEFAWLRDAWFNLPEALAEIYPSSEHLRKRALIDAGYYDETVVDTGSHDAALRVAAVFRAREEFALVIVRGPVVVIRTARSQSRRAMKRQEFQELKTAIMEVVDAMLAEEYARLAAAARPMLPMGA